MGEDYLSETFLGLRKKEFELYGEYRTQRLVLATYDELATDLCRRWTRPGAPRRLAVTDGPLHPRPASSYTLTEIETAFRNHGWRADPTIDGRWHVRASATAPGTLRLAALDGEQFAVRAPMDGVMAGLRADGWETVVVDGDAAFVVADSGTLVRLVSRCYRLAVSLPEAPLEEFRRRVARDAIRSTSLSGRASSHTKELKSPSRLLRTDGETRRYE